MKKVIFTIIFLLISISTFAQDFGLALKFSKNIGKSYNAYSNLAFEGLYSFYDKKIEVGPAIGIIYSEPNLDFDFHIPNYYEIDIIDIPRLFIGLGLYYYPIVYEESYLPFVGISGKYLYKCGCLNFLNSGANNIMEAGLFGFSAKNDMIFSFSTGLKIIQKNGINFIFEIEYQYRNFILKFDEYDISSEDGYLYLIKSHSENRSIHAINFGIGVQFDF